MAAYVRRHVYTGYSCNISSMSCTPIQYIMYFFSEPLTTDVDDITVSDAINALPIFAADESVTVVRQQTTTPTFVFTFQSNRGLNA